MSDILCVTNRALCTGEFLARLEEIAACHPRGILLREKDLPEAEYRLLAERALEVCGKHGACCILHSFPETALALGADALHLPLPLLRQLGTAEKARFSVLGASCHSVEEAQEAQRLGCTYITAGHIFATDCKKGLPGRGLDFLRSVCQQVSIPVYAIGGIDNENIAAVRVAGAAGACVMSGVMRCADVESYLKSLEKAGERHGLSQ